MIALIWAWCVLDLPHIRQEALQFADRGDGDVGQYAGQVALGVEVVAFGAGDQGIQRGGGGAGLVVAGEEPVFAVDGDALQGPFGGVVVDVQGQKRG